MAKKKTGHAKDSCQWLPKMIGSLVSKPMPKTMLSASLEFVNKLD